MYEATYMKRLRTTKFIEKTEEWLPETGGGRNGQLLLNGYRV